MKGYFGVMLSVLVLSSCAPKWTRTEHLNHPDAGFKYKVRVEKSHGLPRDRQKEYMVMNQGFESFEIEEAEAFTSLSSSDVGIASMIDEETSLPESVSGTSANTKSNPLSISMERFILISDAYVYVDDERTKVDKAETPPRFKNSDERKFIRWVAKRNKFRMPANVIMNSSCKGHVIFDITIDKKGKLSEINPLVVRDPFFNGEIAESFMDMLSGSPEWTPAHENGEPVDAKYLVAMVWGHYRQIDYDSPLYQKAIEDGYDPLDVFIPRKER